MGERLDRFEYLMEDRELTVRAGEIMPLVDDIELQRLQAIARMYAEKNRTTHEGHAPVRLFGEEGGAICAAFIERMAASGYAGSSLLENELTATAAPRGSSLVNFWTPPVGRLQGTPYLCEDGRLRAYTPFLEAATDKEKGERCLVHDLPIDTVTTRLRPVIPIMERQDGAIIYGLEDVLLAHVEASAN